MMKKILVILGPTATGKTDLAINLAKKLGGELIACDSRQVYRGLDIGTGKLPGGDVEVVKQSGLWIVDGIKIWLYDVVDVSRQYNAADYVKDSSRVIEDIESRGKSPIIVGGTGLYLKGLLEGFDVATGQINAEFRAELEELSLEQLQQRLANLSPEIWSELNNSDQKNRRRLVRRIEIVSTNPHENTNKNAFKTTHQVLKIGLTAPKIILNLRIDERLDKRITQGLIKEGERLLKQGLTTFRMRQLGLEYSALADLLEGKINREEFRDQLVTKIHQYAKRQMTWFKKDQEINWFDVSQPEFLDKVANLASNWYNRDRT